ncbi:MAG: hypothetical protein EU530_02295 [Promethearchaeota archaeon]|nr:MAG: hypothetical protein EU530_02295 [Candidatus Lokiarchaeota archaeon]
MEQHVEAKSEVSQVQKPISKTKFKHYKKLDTEIKVHEIAAAPDYLPLNSTEFIQHFTNMITANEEYDLFEYHKNYIKVMGYANRGLLETCLDYFTQKNENLIVATTPLHHTSWRDGIEKFVKHENIHIIDVNDSLNGLEKFPNIDKCDLVIITHQFGQDFDLNGLDEFKKKTGAIVMEDRVQGGTQEIKFSSPLADITLYSMAMDKRPIALGGAFLYMRKENKEIAEAIIKMIASYPPEPIRKRFIDLLKKIPTYLLYNKKRVTYIFLKTIQMLKLNLLDFTNTYRKKNPGFERNNFTLKPSKGLMKSMSQHYYDYRNMENLYEEKHMLFRSYLSDDIIRRFFPWYRDAGLTPYNTIYVDEKFVKKFLKFMNRSYVCIIWNPTYKMFNFDYPGKEKHQKFHDGIIYLPCLATMSHEEIRYLADRITKFDAIVSK